MKIDLDCRDASRLLSAAQDSALPLGERTRLRLHLLICHTCRQVDAQIGFLRRAMQRLGGRDEGPPDAGSA